MVGQQEAKSYRQTTLKTAKELRTFATITGAQDLSHLSLPEIEELSNEIARVIPAGNTPALILSGLAKVRSRKVDTSLTQQYLGLLFKGVRQSLDEAVYTTFFAGPAAILYGYQQLLRFAGKDVEMAFPEGTWQFYLEFALREDGARHANETTGFHQKLAANNIKLNEADMLAAWVIATAFFIKDLPHLLSNEWYEAVVCSLLTEIAAEAPDVKTEQFQNLHRKWQRQLPYQRHAAAGDDTYTRYRKKTFESFIKPYTDALPVQAKQAFTQRLRKKKQQELLAYQHQLSWLAHLEPERYREARMHYPLEEANIGIIWQNRYYLLPLSAAFDPDNVRATVTAILNHQSKQTPATLDDVLVTTKRSEQASLRQQLDDQTRQDIELLKHTPVLINWDEQNVAQPLAKIRQGKRGIGDQALTIFRTAESIIFDQSHIFFDGAWGAAVAEIMTNEALSWARYYAQAPKTASVQACHQPTLQAPKGFATQAQKFAIPAETSAETDKIRMGPILATRKLLKQRSELAQVTVNDLFILYRGLHALAYEPSPKLKKALAKLAKDKRPETQRALRLIHESLTQLHSKNPAILIPIDAKSHAPRERLVPMTFRNPFTDFMQHHQHTMSTLRAYKADKRKNRKKTFQAFHEAQLFYLRLIGSFGEILSCYKNAAMEGQSTSTTTIQLLGHLTPALQNMLDKIPSKFDVLNEIIKGEEVFSNVGRVAKGSTLRRFITAKDDNEQKTLMWGVITNDDNTVRLSLRDFRPHVKALHDIGRHDLAQLIAQDYIDAYAQGMNQYIVELQNLTIASRETLLAKRKR